VPSAARGCSLRVTHRLTKPNSNPHAKTLALTECSPWRRPKTRAPSEGLTAIRSVRSKSVTSASEALFACGRVRVQVRAQIRVRVRARVRVRLRVRVRVRVRVRARHCAPAARWCRGPRAPRAPCRAGRCSRLLRAEATGRARGCVRGATPGRHLSGDTVRTVLPARTYCAWAPEESCPAPQVRMVRSRPARAPRT